MGEAATWRELGDRFAGLDTRLGGSRLDAQLGGDRDYWRLAAAHDLHARDEFRSLAMQAGTYLRTSPLFRKLPATIKAERDPEHRWYRAMAEMAHGFKIGFGWADRAGGVTQASGIGGSMRDPVKAAVALTRNLEATLPPPGWMGRVGGFIARHSASLIVGVLASVIAGVILLLLEG